MPDTAFQQALASGDLAAIRACSKADLHVHATLGGCRAYLKARTGRDIAPLQGVLGSMAEMHAWADAAIGDLFEGADGRALAFDAAPRTSSSAASPASRTTPSAASMKPASG